MYSSVNMTAGWQTPPKYGYDFELRADAPNGKLLGAGTLTPPQNKKQQFGIIHVNMQPVTDGQNHIIYVIAKPKDQKESFTGGIVSLTFN